MSDKAVYLEPETIRLLRDIGASLETLAQIQAYAGGHMEDRSKKTFELQRRLEEFLTKIQYDQL